MTMKLLRLLWRFLVAIARIVPTGFFILVAVLSLPDCYRHFRNYRNTLGFRVDSAFTYASRPLVADLFINGTVCLASVISIALFAAFLFGLDRFWLWGLKGMRREFREFKSYSKSISSMMFIVLLLSLQFRSLLGLDHKVQSLSLFWLRLLGWYPSDTPIVFILVVLLPVVFWSVIAETFLPAFSVLIVVALIMEYFQGWKGTRACAREISSRRREDAGVSCEETMDN